MSKTSLKASIATVVKTNGVRSITGSNLRGKLDEIVDAIYPTADATALDGTEVIIVQQSSERVETTTQAIADLGGGGTWVTLGTIGFADVNASGATAAETFYLTTNEVDATLYYVDMIAFNTTQGFASVTEDVILGLQNYVPYLTATTAKGVFGGTENSLAGLLYQTQNTSYPYPISLIWLTSNPQDYTAGSITFYGLMKPFPF